MSRGNADHAPLPVDELVPEAPVGYFFRLRPASATNAGDLRPASSEMAVILVENMSPSRHLESV